MAGRLRQPEKADKQQSANEDFKYFLIFSHPNSSRARLTVVIS
jgi:hypothetical protein